MPEQTPLPATVTVNGTTGPTLQAGELLDVYLTDGMRVQAIGGTVGFTGPNWTSPAIVPMRGPVGISALIENGLDPTLNRPDRGLSLAQAPNGHHSVSPLNVAMADPYAQPRYTTVPLSITVPGVMISTTSRLTTLRANLGSSSCSQMATR